MLDYTYDESQVKRIPEGKRTLTQAELAELERAEEEAALEE